MTSKEARLGASAHRRPARDAAMSTTMTLTGVLHRYQERKHERDWLKDYARLLSEQAGHIAPRMWPEEAYVEGDDLGSTGRPAIWNVNPKAFGAIPSGTRVRFVASVSRWDNGGGHSLGGDCRRVRKVEVLP